MKTILVYTLCLGTLASSAFSEEERRPDGKGFPDGRKPPREMGGHGEKGKRDGSPHGGQGEMFKRMDKDNDGKITKEEFFAAPRFERLPDEKREKLFSRLDRDGDGVIGREEIREMRKDAEERAKQEFRELDKNGDGGLNFEEFSEGRFFKKLPEEKRKEIFARMDTNGDGKITPEDKPERPRRPDHRPEGKRGERPDKTN